MLILIFHKVVKSTHFSYAGIFNNHFIKNLLFTLSMMEFLIMI